MNWSPLKEKEKGGDQTSRVAAIISSKKEQKEQSEVDSRMQLQLFQFL